MSRHPFYTFTTRILPIALAFLASLTGCRPSGDNKPAIETVPVKTGDLIQLVTASGTLSAVVSVDVGSQISGRIQKLNVDFNSSVKKGDVLAEIEPSLYKAAVNESQGELISAQAALELTRLTANRQNQLVQRKVGTQADADSAKAENLKAEANVTISQAKLDKAKTDLTNCQIISSLDGIVISRKVDVGQTVAAAMTTPVFFTIAQDIKKMQIVASVSEADIGQVAVDQKVDFTVDAFPEEIFHGNVIQVRKAATTTENVVTYDTVIGVDNPEQKLFPGMTAEVSIYVAERKNIPTLANAALRFTPPEGIRFSGNSSASSKLARGERLVYLAAQNGTSLQPVIIKVGITNAVDTEIIGGLKVGDRVVSAATAPKKSSGPFSGGGPPGGGGGPP